MFESAMNNRKAGGGRGFTLASARVGSQPDWVFVFGSFGESSTFTRGALLASFDPLTNDAMMHYSRSRCLLIVDRDGKSYEVGMAQLTSPPPSEGEYTSKVFGPLKTSAKELHFRPARTASSVRAPVANSTLRAFTHARGGQRHAMTHYLTAPAAKRRQLLMI
jgi:hypothetical protein